MNGLQLHQRKTRPWIIAIIAFVTVIAASLLGFRVFNTKANAEAKDRQQSAQSNTPQSTDSQSEDLQSGDTPSPVPTQAEITKPSPPNGLYEGGLVALRILGCGGWCWHGVGACPMIEVATLQTLGGPDMGNGTFSALDMTTYCGLVELGLVAVGMRCQEGGFVLKCRAANPARLCPGCGHPGDALGSRTRRLAHEPRGHQPTMLVVYVGRYRCRACSRSWCDDISQAAPPRAKLSFGALRWGLVCLIADNMSINRIAAHLAVAWHTANEAILAYGEELLLADSTRFEGVRVIGVDEHVWRHRGGDRYATVIVDLTPVRDHTGPARLLDVVQGRSKYVLSSWLAVCPQEWKDNIEIVAMDGFSGYKSAAASYQGR